MVSPNWQRIATKVKVSKALIRNIRGKYYVLNIRNIISRFTSSFRRRVLDSMVSERPRSKSAHRRACTAESASTYGKSDDVHVRDASHQIWLSTHVYNVSRAYRHPFLSAVHQASN
jgi:hypothetical protein